MAELVTGAAGFIGSTLCRRLLDEGRDVVGIDSLTDYYDRGLKRSNLERLAGDRFHFVEDDLNTTDLQGLLRGVTTVYHQAGQPGVRASWGSEFTHYTSANVQATQRLLEAVAASTTLERFVYASSSSVYGDAQTFPTEEDARPQPVSPYGVTKLAGEHLCVLYARSVGLPTVSLRYFTVYGPRQRPDMAFARFLRSALAGQEIPLFGDGSQVRDFTYVDDVVEANLLVAASDVEPGTVLNVAGGSSVSMSEVVELVRELHGPGVRVRRHPPVAGDVRRTGGSTALLREATGWRPTTGIETGLARQYDWVRSAP